MTLDNVILTKVILDDIITINMTSDDVIVPVSLKQAA